MRPVAFKDAGTLAGWNWQDVYTTWAERLADFNLNPENSFLTLTVHDPATPIRAAEAAWWKADKVADEHLHCQLHFDRWPGTQGPTAREGERTGVQQTLWHIIAVQDDPEAVAAVLIAGSLFSRLESSRGHYPRHWPDRREARRLLDMAYQRWASASRTYGWPHTCTSVLPFENADYLSEFASPAGLIRYLAEEHASVRLKYRLVTIQFGGEADPMIAARIKRLKEAEAAQRQVHGRAAAESKRLEQERVAGLRSQHPRFGDWERLPREELIRLVWTKPRTQIAAEFGVSDVAIGKRCRSAQVPAPPVGFWAKVKAGKVAHPNGVPPADSSFRKLEPVPNRKDQRPVPFSLFKKRRKSTVVKSESSETTDRK